VVVGVKDGSILDVVFVAVVWLLLFLLFYQISTIKLISYILARKFTNVLSFSLIPGLSTQ